MDSTTISDIHGGAEIANLEGSYVYTLILQIYIQHGWGPNHPKLVSYQ